MTDKSPMNSRDVFAAIEAIGATSSKKEKDALVKEGMQDELFKRVCVAAYDPFITYGVASKTMAQIAPACSSDGRQFNEHTWALLDGLAKRELTGVEATNAIAQELAQLDDSSYLLLKRILLGDLRAGFSEDTVNRVAPGTLAEFPYMRCSTFEKAGVADEDWAKGYVSQEKADGMFANVNLDVNRYLWITTRQGTPFPEGSLGRLEDAMRHNLIPGTQTHGELLVLKDGKLLPRQEGNGVLNSILKGGALEEGLRVEFYAWDQIPLSAVKPKGKVDVPYKKRLAALANYLVAMLPDNGARAECPVRIIDTRIVRSKKEAFAHFTELLALGKEGTIVSNPDGIWRDGTSKDKVKLKVEADIDLLVTGKTPGEGKNASTFGALTCVTSCGQLSVNVGSGISDKLRKQLHDDEDTIGSIITVRANDIMPPSNGTHSLFLPRLIEKRLDKKVADTLERVREIFEAAKAAA